MLYDLIKDGFGKEENYNCSEQILYGANKAYDLGLSKDALKLSAAFGGGMGIESVCGALTGAVMAISSKFVRTIAREDEGVKELTKELFTRYEKEMGSIQCDVLKDKYRNEDIGCRDVILAAAKILDDIMENHSIERRSFILGMITAFAECVATECKKIALSPPFYMSDYDTVLKEAERIAEEQGVHLWYDENLDIPEEQRVCWFVIYKFQDALDEYRALREEGFNPAWEFDKFWDVLSYGNIWGENAEKVLPRLREQRETEDTVSRILFQPGEWPPSREDK